MAPVGRRYFCFICKWRSQVTGEWIVNKLDEKRYFPDNFFFLEYIEYWQSISNLSRKRIFREIWSFASSSRCKFGSKCFSGQRSSCDETEKFSILPVRTLGARPHWIILHYKHNFVYVPFFIRSMAYLLLVGSKFKAIIWARQEMWNEKDARVIVTQRWNGPIVLNLNLSDHRLTIGGPNNKQKQ